MAWRLNSTEEYHRQGLDTLGWELTVSNSLFSAASPCRRILKKNRSYGQALHEWLSQSLPMPEIRRILEVGGGYGHVMGDFLDCHGECEVAMLDICPVLLAKQRAFLGGRRVTFLQEDVLETAPGLFASMDLVICNENLADLPTVVGLAPEDLANPPAPGQDDPLSRVGRFFGAYGLPLPPGGALNVNLGALELVEKICRAGTPYAFLSEHSCEAAAPPVLEGCLRFRSAGTPERIRLKGHDEYTIQFSFLEAIARAWRYDVLRGPLADFLQIDLSEALRRILSRPWAGQGEHEIWRHFVEDLYRYEYLLLIHRERDPTSRAGRRRCGDGSPAFSSPRGTGDPAE